MIQNLAFQGILVFLSGVAMLNGCKNTVDPPIPPGPTWVTFTSPRLPDNRVKSLFVDRQQRVWVATINGAAAFKNNSWSIFKDSLRYTIAGQVTSRVNCITESRDRSIWFGLAGGGIARYDEFSQNGNIWVRYREPTILYNSPAALTAELSNASQFGEVWISTQIGVNRFIQTSTDGGGAWSVYTGSPPLPNTQMTSAAANPVDNTIWLGAQSGGAIQVSYYPTFGITTIPLPPGHDARINGMVFDANNTVWFAKETEVSSLDQTTGAWTHYNHTNTGSVMPVGEVHAVETDLHNTHWFGTDRGLVMLKDTVWQKFNAGTGTIVNDTVTALKYDLRGNLWIGTRSGVSVYNPAGTNF